MTATELYPRLSPSTTPASFAEGTLVRIEHNEGLYKINRPAAWSDTDPSTPTHYDVTGPSGQRHRMVPAERISLHSDALRLALTSHLAVVVDPLEIGRQRMLADPPATMEMARRFLPQTFIRNHNLREIVRELAPRYFETHCHRCGTELDNLHHPTCPDCEGLHCKCGGCRCNWSFPSSGIHGVTGPRIRQFSTRHVSLR
jgi:hypothetical protein